MKRIAGLTISLFTALVLLTGCSNTESFNFVQENLHLCVNSKVKISDLVESNFDTNKISFNDNYHLNSDGYELYKNSLNNIFLN